MREAVDRLLEERVLRMISRLRELDAERERLLAELREARDAVTRLETERGDDEGARTERERWRGTSAAVAGILREAIADLKTD